MFKKSKSTKLFTVKKHEEKPLFFKHNEIHAPGCENSIACGSNMQP